MKESKIHQILVEGMTCSNCAMGIEKKLVANGVKQVNVNFASGKVSYQSNHKRKEVEKMIKAIGFKIKNTENKQNILAVEKLFYFTLIFTTPLFLHMFVDKTNVLHNPLLQFILCLPVYITGCLYFGKSALQSIKNKIPNMDVLIFIGSTSAFLYSIYGWILFNGTERIHDFLFFETCATIITLVLLGNVLEKKSVQKTTTAIKELNKIKNINAKRERDGKIEIIDFQEILINDILIINSGDRIPTDGIIISGTCSIDESIVTGEHVPLNKTIQNEVIGGTLIVDGSIKIKVTKVGDDTFLSKIIALIENSQKNKPSIQRIGDKVSSYFVPFVIFLSILTLISCYFIFKIDFQSSLLRSIAVLVISCPCAMGLATPTAVMVGIGRAAKNGILIKGGDTLEKIASIKRVVFDKTGTLTNGDFVIKELNIIEGQKQEIKNIIYSLENYSNHPIAKSLCKILKTEAKEMPVDDLKENKGVGIKATINNNKYHIGSFKIRKNLPKGYDIYLLKNDKLIASIILEDQLKNDIKNVINNLLSHGYYCAILSGDKNSTCKSIANKLGIEEVYSEYLPEDKLKKIKELRSIYPTAMVGDGINDAPALSESTVGISLSKATQIAINSANVVLLNNNNLNQLPKTLSIAKHTLITIKQNLFWAFSYNIIAIPIAMLGLLNPMQAALFMAFSDIIVIGNSIRLRYKKIFY